jgi:CheY-like chemotaxis protein
MDGIEAANIIRSLGYTNSIVALTANALVGQTEIFFQNGFDGYISKPIDSRELNHVLNDLIRNKKPQEVVDAAREEQNRIKLMNMGISPQDITKASEIERFFVLDAENAVKILRNITTKIYNLDEDGINTYVITTHGIKSALSNIGETELSSVANKLEKAGRDRNLAVMSDETPALIDALEYLIEKYKPAEESNVLEMTHEDIIFLCEKLETIKTACTALDKKAAKNALKDLKHRKWPDHINIILDDISANLLHSEFRKVVVIAEKTIKRWG